MASNDKELRELTEKEEAFLEAYLSNGFDRRAAMKASGINSPNPHQYAIEILNRPPVIAEMGKRLEAKRTKLFVNEQDVLEGLYKEATRENKEGGTSATRINAWQAIGKHLGMFDDKVKELEKKAKALPQNGGGTNIQIINYNIPSSEGDPIVTRPEKFVKSQMKELKDITDGETQE